MLLQKMNSALGSCCWKGSVGSPAPTEGDVLNALASQDVFLFFGHGRGATKLLTNEMLHRGAVLADDASQRRLPLKAIVMLMGCSSVKVLPPTGKYSEVL